MNVFQGTFPAGDTGADGFVGPAPVDAFAPNGYGAYNMTGNVWEWCADWYEPGQTRALRGGSWNNSGHLCRSARRQKYASDFRADNVGFRVALGAGA